MNRKNLKHIWTAFLDLFADDDPDEPFYDPVSLGGAVIASIVAIGALYWLLWTLLVYEGGLPPKIGAALQVLFSSKTLKDFGYEGTPYARGAFEGWFGNLAALLLCAAALAALHRLYHQAKARAKRAK